LRGMLVYVPTFAGTKLYCLATRQATRCEKLAQSFYASAPRPGVEPSSTRTQVRPSVR